MFQSPRSGKFVSNFVGSGKKLTRAKLSFNPLDRGNLYQISSEKGCHVKADGWFQSPRSGKFVSDILKENDQDFEWYPVSIP